MIDPVAMDLPPPLKSVSRLRLANDRIAELEAENDRLKLIIERFLFKIDKAGKELGESLSMCHGATNGTRRCCR